ncbi:16S rRNA (guanine(527)-N(7))-methyltransferase RsmG [Maritimibacter sp. UBA3975]|uniref:16S rRNA (guanine(527)-N(7))-methyltransferase RsmG n=1 Tax=Maritimibacter sp. UBA3975 TaxID=1946833 RepID=UPI000C0B7EBC|nr:16S rRNA (guanine(527)-N(7))-methyltransferase RsmG [Maritimibacter sp. UBA3975]MAM63437.1 16S rRNA (guanine(527)-N(7))-methyltransferase RsmG [Maritimibacter sp.]|tara:strand:+ start:40914 stop:41534 length:621 start_codon:yes stop_codon:yes gene_type:complete
MTPEQFAETSNVSRETLDKLTTYAALLERWNPKINLVSKQTLPELWSRHFLDSAQLLSLAPEKATSWLDLGTGGGFPGLIVAILASEKRPKLNVTCVESDQRKSAFLRTVTRETGASATILSRRIEILEPQGADIVSARALAPLKTLLGFARRHLSSDGIALFPKGSSSAPEIQEALETWTFQADTYPSLTHDNAVILKIGDIHRA